MTTRIGKKDYEDFDALGLASDCPDCVLLPTLFLVQELVVHAQTRIDSCMHTIEGLRAAATGPLGVCQIKCAPRFAMRNTGLDLWTITGFLRLCSCLYRNVEGRSKFGLFRIADLLRPELAFLLMLIPGVANEDGVNVP